MTNISWNTMSSNTTTLNIILAAPNYASAAFLSLTQLFGVLGNVLIIYSIVSQRSLLRRNYYFLVLHLAFCDLMVLLLSFYDMYEALYLNSFFTRSLAMCKVWQPTLTDFSNAGVHIYSGANCNLPLHSCFISVGVLVSSYLYNLGILVSSDLYNFGVLVSSDLFKYCLNVQVYIG